jgi:hypothetical protein
VRSVPQPPAADETAEYCEADRPQLTLSGFYVLDGLADAPVELWPVSA